MDRLLNQLKATSAQLDHGWAQPRLGIVKSVDCRTYSVRVTIQPDGTLTGWLPVAAAWIGNGWGLVCSPLPGDQVVVLWQEGDAEQGVVIGRLWSEVVLPPLAPAGELWLQHRSGSYIQLSNDGSIKSNAAVWQHTGDLKVSGDIFDRHGSVDALRSHYNAHVHPPAKSLPDPID